MEHLTESDTTSPPVRDIYTISRLNREVRSLLETGLPLLWLEGELSNLARPGSGHMYFSLKDETAQVRCAMFHNRSYLLNFTPQNGMQVLVRARISLYEPRGEFQIIVEHMEEAGDGALRRAFDLLKQKLNAEGLFASERKQPLPAPPHCLGVITSPTGAVIHDILTTLKRRFPALPVIIYPTAVQGKEAAGQIVEAIHIAQQRQECDVLILARGGGSLEDLWSFNDENVARAIAASTIPVVCGVGHDVDFTIADFVADRRAPTPTAAAELISPDRQALLQHLGQWQARLRRQVQSLLQQYRHGLAAVAKRLQHPGRRLQLISQRIDEYDLRMQRCIRRQLKQAGSALNASREHLWHLSPLQHIQQRQQQLTYLRQRLLAGITTVQSQRQQQLQAAGRALHAISPLATLDRGYAIISNIKGEVVMQASTVKPGDKISARVKQGRLECLVEKIYEKN